MVAKQKILINRFYAAFCSTSSLLQYVWFLPLVHVYSDEKLIHLIQNLDKKREYSWSSIMAITNKVFWKSYLNLMTNWLYTNNEVPQILAFPSMLLLLPLQHLGLMCSPPVAELSCICSFLCFRQSLWLNRKNFNHLIIQSGHE